MPVRPARPPRTPPRPLDQRLTLAMWFADQMGYADNLEMLLDLRESSENWDGEKHPALRRAADRGKVKIQPDALAEMDDNIRADLALINRHRTPRVTLKYFQYLSALAVENFLRRYSADREELARELRTFARHRDQHGRYPAPQGADDLNKLALWAATGAGKTLLMHLNYRQFLRRRKSGLFVPEGVILLTPNETLSEQHIEEMRLSGIPCGRLHESAGGLGMEGDFPVRVVEITKFTARRKGAASVPLDAFSGRNLLLVDEGHRGAAGKAYFAVRDQLAARGFVLEYSATYGQAFAPQNPRTEEYARSIVFDYSYRHFHGDGYGKEFNVANLAGDDPAPEKQQAMMLGNLLVFLQQRLCFAENRAEFLRHNLEPPLMLMLGAKVTGGGGKTEIVEFVEFLHRVSLEKEWLRKTVAKILAQDGGDSAEPDIFANRLDWLRARFAGKNGKPDIQAICGALLENVLLAENPGALNFCPVRGTKGEAALRVGNGPYFALIYVGDVIRKLRDLVKEHVPGVQTGAETLSGGPMFPGVGRADSQISVLIGAKQFMEGWSSWRVSGMGLLNVGVSEGPLVIQLFGRGVRLKGANMSLKRGGDGNPPPNLALLETMNIFGVRANFIARFREMLEREGVWEETIHLPTSPPMPEGLNAELQMPKHSGKEFTRPVALDATGNIRAIVNLSSSVLQIASAGDDANSADALAPEGAGLSKAALAAVDWDELHRQLQEYRAHAGLWNLFFPLENLPVILRDRCAFVCDPDKPLEPVSRRDIRRIRDAAVAAMKKYARKFHSARRGEWELERIEYQPLKEEHPNFPEPGCGYVLRVPQKETEIIEGIRELVKSRKKLAAMWSSDSNGWRDLPPRVHFSRHLYQPLLLARALKKKNIRVSPPGLNEGEVEFVNKLGERLHDDRLKDAEIFLLRNASQTGLGFHGESGGVYPDFILWIKRGKKQRVIFIEPHGMVFADAHDDDPKARLYETLKPVISKLKDERPDVKMDAFVVSRTPYETLRRKYGKGWSPQKFKDCHILFAGDDYIADILAEKE